MTSLSDASVDLALLDERRFASGMASCATHSAELDLHRHLVDAWREGRFGVRATARYFNVDLCCRSRDEAWKKVIYPNRHRVLIRLVLDEDPTVGGVTDAECEHPVQQDVGDVPVRVFEGGHASDDTGGIHECIDFEFVTNHTAADVTERGI